MKDLMQDLKTELMDIMEGTADWRMQKADQYPEDTRNVNSATALRKAYEAVAALPENHSLFTLLVLADGFGRERWAEQQNHFIARWGFGLHVYERDFVSVLSEEAEKFIAQVEAEEE